MRTVFVCLKVAARGLSVNQVSKKEKNEREEDEEEEVERCMTTDACPLTMSCHD
jgi:hypothetical protein